MYKIIRKVTRYIKISKLTAKYSHKWTDMQIVGSIWRKSNKYVKRYQDSDTVEEIK